MSADAATRVPVDPSALTRAQFRALAEDLLVGIPAARVEVQVTTQDTEGNWMWGDGEEAALWSERYRADVRYRARIVTDWVEVR